MTAATSIKKIPKSERTAAANRPLLWPDDVAEILGIAGTTLDEMRSRGDAPRLYLVSARRLMTTHSDLMAWITAREVPPNVKLRAPTTGSNKQRKVPEPENA